MENLINTIGYSQELAFKYFSQRSETKPVKFQCSFGSVFSKCWWSQTEGEEQNCEFKL